MNRPNTTVGMPSGEADAVEPAGDRHQEQQHIEAAMGQRAATPFPGLQSVRQGRHDAFSCRQPAGGPAPAQHQHAERLVQLVELELRAEVAHQPDHGEAHREQADHQNGDQPVQQLGGPAPGGRACCRAPCRFSPAARAVRSKRTVTAARSDRRAGTGWRRRRNRSESARPRLARGPRRLRSRSSPGAISGRVTPLSVSSASTS